MVPPNIFTVGRVHSERPQTEQSENLPNRSVSSVTYLRARVSDRASQIRKKSKGRCLIKKWLFVEKMLAKSARIWQGGYHSTFTPVLFSRSRFQTMCLSL